MTALPRRSSGRRAAPIAGVVAGAALAGILVARALTAATPAASAGAPPGGTPAPPSRAAARFVNVAATSGLLLQNVSGDIEKPPINEPVGNGVCLQDVDGDGLLDIFLPNGARARQTPEREPPRSALYRNRGDGTFEDITARAGVGSQGYWAQGCVFADYDGDGRVDLFLTGFGRYILYRGLGGGRFQDVTAAAGLSGGR